MTAALPRIETADAGAAQVLAMAAGTIDVDLEQATMFLDVLAEGRAVTFQVFDDEKEKRGGKERGGLAKHFHGTLEQRFTELVSLNRRGAGVFVMVNHGDGQGRSGKNVTGIRAVFVDLDGTPPDRLLAFKPVPHIIVESSPGRYHGYWLIADCALDRFRPIQESLAAYFDGDTAVKDLPRVMRVPGFFHRKAEPFLSRIHSIEPLLQPYTVSDLMAVVPSAKRSQKTNTRSISIVSGTNTPQDRNVTLASRAGALRRKGVSETEITGALLAMNAQWDNPLPEDEVHKIAHSISRYEPAAAEDPDAVTVDDFYAYMPMHQYIFVGTRELWPASSVNKRIPPVMQDDGKELKASDWLDQNRAVEQMVWAPGETMVIENRLMANGGWITKPGCSTFNLYIPPQIEPGDPKEARRWIDHVRRVYPQDAEHIIKFLAHRVQKPREKINHAIVLGGKQGIGKDTALEPLRYAVGLWNVHEVSPAHLLGRFNSFIKSVILRVSEARDLGDVDRYAFYEHLKTLTAAPPDVLRCDEKHIREHAILNVCGVIVTTNHKDGIYLPSDDRRHYVAWSDLDRSAFDQDYWNSIYRWFASGGNRHVAAYLASLDLTTFDPKAPPPKTQAFWDIVDANRAPEDAELADVLDGIGYPSAVALGRLVERASGDFQDWLMDRRNRRQIPHRMESAGYTPVRNPSAESGLWVVGGRRQAVYAKTSLPVRDRLAAAAALVGEARQ